MPRIHMVSSLSKQYFQVARTQILVLVSMLAAMTPTRLSADSLSKSFLTITATKNQMCTTATWIIRS
jgi:hypothetical protein